MKKKNLYQGELIVEARNTGINTYLERMKKEEILTEIYELLLSEFNQFGFYPNKKKNIYIKEDGAFEFNFEINISSKQTQHIILSVVNESIERIFYSIKLLYIEQEKKEHLKKGRTTICSLTDWKNLYSSNNKEIGEVWFKTFSDLEEIRKSKEQYILAIQLAIQWFNKCKDLTYVYHYNLDKRFTTTIEMALCIGKYLGKDIQKEYDNFVIENKNFLGWDKKQVDIFLDYLNRVST